MLQVQHSFTTNQITAHSSDYDLLMAYIISFVLNLYPEMAFLPTKVIKCKPLIESRTKLSYIKDDTKKRHEMTPRETNTKDSFVARLSHLKPFMSSWISFS